MMQKIMAYNAIIKNEWIDNYYHFDSTLRSNLLA